MWESLRGGARSTSQSQHQDGQPHGLAFGVQRNSHALHTLRLWQGGPAGWTSQASYLRSQTFGGSRTEGVVLGYASEQTSAMRRAMRRCQSLG